MIQSRWLLTAITCLVAIGWWYSELSPRALDAPRLRGDRTPTGCSPPPLVSSGAAPLQSPLPAGMRSIELDAATLRPLAGFSVDARVLSTERYRFDRGADLSPIDLALGWQDMSRDAVLEKLTITQSSRWYHYRWRDQPPMPVEVLARQSANMHLVPASRAVAATLGRVRRDQRVRIDGWLVEAAMPDGVWRSSTTRDDVGNGACELIYVCAISLLPR